jgi:hypothetical protein
VMNRRSGSRSSSSASSYSAVFTGSELKVVGVGSVRKAVLPAGKSRIVPFERWRRW